MAAGRWYVASPEGMGACSRGWREMREDPSPEHVVVWGREAASPEMSRGPSLRRGTCSREEGSRATGTGGTRPVQLVAEPNSSIANLCDLCAIAVSAAAH